MIFPAIILEIEDERERSFMEAQYSRTQPEMGRHLRAAERRQRWHSAARKRIPQVLKVAVILILVLNLGVAVTGEIGTVTYIKGEDQYVRIRVESKRAEGNIDTEDSSISWIRVHGHEVVIAENFSVIEKSLTRISKYLSQHPSLERPICRGSKEGF